MSRRNALQLLLLAAIWGASFLFLRIGVPVFGPAKLIFLRVALVAVFLTGVALWFKQALALRGNARHYLVIGVLSAGLPFLLYGYAAQALNASMLAIVNAMTPIFGALVAAVWLRVPLRPLAMLGLALGFGGVLLIVGADLGTRGAQDWLSYLAALGAPFCYAIATSYTRKYAAAIPPFAQAHGSCWSAALTTLPLALWLPARAEPAAGDWLAVLALAVLCTGWAYLIFFHLLASIGPARTMTVTFLIPVFGVLWGHLFLGEAVTLTMLIGGVIVLFGTALANGLIGRRGE
ncbi:MAG: DMT family transporter [Rhodocyclaceae bacterium]